VNKTAHADDLELADLKHLLMTQEEMIKKLTSLEDQSNYGEGDSQSSLLKPPKKLDGMSKKIGWRKGWTWKQSPVKSASIEEEPVGLLESPKRSHHSSKSSTPNLSPKHSKNISSSETIHEDTNPSGSVLVRRKQRQQQHQQKSDAKVELRSSASARLIQFLESKDAIDKINADEFFSLMPEKNGRPASIHVIQTVRNDDVL
jgi:hypothetical protein